MHITAASGILLGFLWAPRLGRTYWRGHVRLVLLWLLPLLLLQLLQLLRQALLRQRLQRTCPRRQVLHVGRVPQSR